MRAATRPPCRSLTVRRQVWLQLQPRGNVRSRYPFSQRPWHIRAPLGLVQAQFLSLLLAKLMASVPVPQAASPSMAVAWLALAQVQVQVLVLVPPTPWPVIIPTMRRLSPWLSPQKSTT